MHKFLIASIMLFTATASSFAAEFGELGGTYTGKTSKGNAIVIVVPKSGTPTYRFAGESVRVSSATLSGKTIRMNVGPNGLARVVVTASGKGASYKYTDNRGSTSATLSKQ
ncbi:hypothetical protein [Agrobacterium vitis]|uniref:hypothetical protein n=1 Tax=Agrobacterium vitis TaxID=373 RepID=UPI0012E7B54F|nr:hypothetical protein [Agrobacterium vitis]MVA72154.1 hypothetical protein [Agrobacterium vitis]NSZ53948.1 hypothetical protein [Agrobacterium vitis]NTA32706.1 hypothetical protein [Agrobacterium vitis]